MSGIETAKFPPGAIIFKEGDKADSVYLLLNGMVEISKKSGDKKIILAILKKDSVFGEMALIDKKPRSATVTAMVPISCLKANEMAFNAAMSQSDVLIKELMSGLVTLIREKNESHKAAMSDVDNDLAIKIKNKNDKFRNDVMTNKAIQEKLKTLDPFVTGVFNSLIRGL